MLREKGENLHYLLRFYQSGITNKERRLKGLLKQQRQYFGVIEHAKKFNELIKEIESLQQKIIKLKYKELEILQALLLEIAEQFLTRGLTVFTLLGSTEVSPENAALNLFYRDLQREKCALQSALEIDKYYESEDFTLTSKGFVKKRHVPDEIVVALEREEPSPVINAPSQDDSQGEDKRFDADLASVKKPYMLSPQAFSFMTEEMRKFLIDKIGYDPREQQDKENNTAISQQQQKQPVPHQERREALQSLGNKI